MAQQTLTVQKAFLPASAQKSFHVYCNVGDVLVVEKEHEHGVTTRLNGVLCFLLDEEVYKYCHPKSLPQS
ncbi:MAG: hypothetical protein KGS72_28870 [Cyanobacteria bacterium REEB67]|nr:hypothetical protein [Cyanobacteria bacterium REEB67]